MPEVRGPLAVHVPDLARSRRTALELAPRLGEMAEEEEAQPAHVHRKCIGIGAPRSARGLGEGERPIGRLEALARAPEEVQRVAHLGKGPELDRRAEAL